MNRYLRRRANRDERRGIDRSQRIVPLPALLDEFTVFDTPQTILDRVSAGEIEAVNNVPVFRDNSGALCEVCPALSGWVFTWERISKTLKLELNLEPLRKLNAKLDCNMPISVQAIASAQITLEQIRRAFRANDRKEITRLATDAQILLLMPETA